MGTRSPNSGSVLSSGSFLRSQNPAPASASSPNTRACSLLKVSHVRKKKRRIKALCFHGLDSSAVNCLVPSIVSLQRVQNDAQCCLLYLLCDDANDCGTKMKWVFPEEIIPVCSERQVITDGMYVHLLSFVCFSFLLSCFLTEAKLRVTHAN